MIVDDAKALVVVVAPALLLLIPDAGGRGKGVLSGKVFEYIAAGRPVLAAVPPDGAAADLIRETGAGVVVAPDDVDGLRRALETVLTSCGISPRIRRATPPCLSYSLSPSTGRRRRLT